MKKCTMLLALVAAMAASPLVVNANCNSCGTSAKKEVKKSCCPSEAKKCAKSECKKQDEAKKCCGSEKCKKAAEAKKSCCGTCKKDK